MANPNWKQGNWNAWIAKFKDSDVKEKLKEIPEQFRETAREHRITLWKIKQSKK